MATREDECKAIALLIELLKVQSKLDRFIEDNGVEVEVSPEINSAMRDISRNIMHELVERVDRKDSTAYQDFQKLESKAFEIEENDRWMFMMNEIKDILHHNRNLRDQFLTSSASSESVVRAFSLANGIKYEGRVSTPLDGEKYLESLYKDIKCQEVERI